MGASPTEIQAGTASTGEWNGKGVKQEKKCRDPIFAILFYANIGAIVGCAIAFGGAKIFKNENADVDEDEVSVNYNEWIYVAVISGGVSIVFSAIILAVMMCIPSFLIKVSLIFNVVTIGVAMVFGFLYGMIMYGILMGVFLALMICYVYCVWSRIPFASANLVTATTAVKQNCGIFIFAYFTVALFFGYTIVWAIAAAGAADSLNKDCDPNAEVCSSNLSGGILFLFLLSYFFTQQVIQNSTHATVAGVVGTWWFVPEEARGCCSAAIRDSIFRTFTSSFGSICFGSLLVALIQALKQMVYQARAQGDGNQILLCIVQCILDCLEDILEYFNKWAFVYVGLYGYSYIEAGKNVMTLFKNRGWDAIIADNLVGMTCGFLSLVVGCLTGGLAVLLQQTTDWFNTYEGNSASIIAFIIGLIIGFLICSILLSVVASGVNAVIGMYPTFFLHPNQFITLFY